MKSRSLALLLAVFCACLIPSVLSGGCDSAVTGRVLAETSVSIDGTTGSATIEIKATDGWVSIAVFLTAPNGNRTGLASGNCGTAGVMLSTSRLAPGDYTYTVYAKPQAVEGSAILSDDEIVSENIVASEVFTIP